MTRYFRYGLGLVVRAAGVAGGAMDPGTASRIAAAKEQIAKNPDQADGYALLALALVKAARATDCANYLKQADQAVADSLRLAPDNFEAQKTRVVIRLAQA